MNENQTMVMEWLISSNTSFLLSIDLLASASSKVPLEISIAFSGLSWKDQLKVVRESADHLLKELA